MMNLGGLTSAGKAKLPVTERQPELEQGLLLRL
jgi:hypothetical protein